MTRAACLVVAGLVVGSVGNAAAQDGREPGDARVLARLPDDGRQGHPMGIAVNGDFLFVATGMWAGSDFFGNNPPTNPAAVYTFPLSAPGDPPTRSDITVQGAALMGMALSTTHAYVVGWGDVIRVDRSTGANEVYATLPHLPVCGSGEPNTPCSPKTFDRRPMGADTVFDAAGNLYVVDQFQGTIWRIPPGPPGRAADVWFQDPRIVGEFIGGAGGVRIGSGGERLYFAVDDKSAIFTLPLEASPGSNDLEVLFTYEPSPSSPHPSVTRCSVTPGALCPYPEGIAFGQSGRLYVALAAANAISVLEPAPEGTSASEVARYPMLIQNPGAFFSYNTPFGVVLDGRGSLLVTNASFLFDEPSQYTILDVFVGDVPEPLTVPDIP